MHFRQRNRLVTILFITIFIVLLVEVVNAEEIPSAVSVNAISVECHN